ncbi:hypothetical protein HZS_4089 [Henneguya salminicola]|nr:hypothetical protein HZS_4089 [Henneguya salminicola]
MLRSYVFDTLYGESGKKDRPGKIYMIDLITAVSVVLRKLVPLIDTIDVDISLMRQDWLDIVMICVPWQKEQRIVLEQLSGIFYDEKDSQKLHEYIENIMQTDEALSAFPIRPKWKTCKYFYPHDKAFDCSIWLLHHVMSIYCYEKNPIFNYASPVVLNAFEYYVFNINYRTALKESFADFTALINAERHLHEHSLLY